MEELNFEIRSMLLNPQYTEALIHTPAGMNSYAKSFQNFYASLVLSGEGLNTQLGNQLAEQVMYISSTVNKGSLAAGSQSSTAWMIYMAQQGLWDADAETLQKLVDTYVGSVIAYGVACCHHTCKNLAWNNEIIQMSSLTPAEKQKYAEILAQATNTDPLYQMPEEEGTSGDNSGSNSGSSDNNGQDSSNAQQLANGTSQDKSSSSDGGNTGFGADASPSGDAKSASESASDASSASASSAGQSGSKVYELSEQSAAKSASATESSMPIFVIIAVLILIAIFLVGYVRNDEDEYDDY